MNILNKILFCFFIGYNLNTSSAFDFNNGIDYLHNFFSNDVFKNSAVESDNKGPTSQLLKGYTRNTLLNSIHSDSNDQCFFYEFPEHTEKNKSNLLKVKCRTSEGGNGTLQLITSKDVIDVLAPYGNSTKRDMFGRCVVILFYTTSCPGCVLIAPKYTALARQFPNIAIAAIDAIKHHTLNTEFGVIALPTIMLFHQGRPVVKFNETSSTVTNFVKFVTKHTGIKPISSVFVVTSDDFNGPLSNKMVNETDVCLFVAWGFILLCSIYYFSRSKTFVYITEMTRRNWIESALMHNSEN